MSINVQVGDEVRLANNKVVVIDHINDNPNYKADDETWAEASSGGGWGNEWVDDPADVFEVLRSATELAARRIPDIGQMREALSAAISGIWHDNDMSIIETSYDGDAGIEFYGESANGLHFAGTVEITSLYRADD